MTNGVTSQVNTVIARQSALGGSETKQSNELASNNSVILSDSEGSDDTFHDEHLSDADRILLSAKEDGFEETLSALANGEFDEVEEGGLDFISTEEQLADGVQIEEENKTAEVSEAPEDDSEQPQNVEDATKIELLSQELKVAQEKIEGLEKNSISREVLMELFLIIAEMSKSETEEEKISLLELLVMAMTRILTEMVTETNSKSQPPVQERKVERNRKPINFEEARKRLEKRGLISPQHQAVVTQAA